MNKIETEKTLAAPAASADKAKVTQEVKRLEARHMPKDYAISLDAFKRGGTDRFLHTQPNHLVKQPMRGFESEYVNIVDYIIRITHRIWEEGDIGYIYDTYSHDSAVWDDYGLQVGRERIVAGTVENINAFPDIRIVADDVIWAGDDEVGFHTSHRSFIMGTNTGYTKYGPPTNKPMRFMCIANCVVRDNEIFHEHVLYNTTSVLRQLGYDVFDMARKMVEQSGHSAFPGNFSGADTKRLPGQGKPALLPMPAAEKFDVAQFAEAFVQNVWNRRMLALLDKVCAPSIVLQGPTDRVYHGVGRYKSYILSMLAAFPDLFMRVDDLYWMGNDREGYRIAMRWSADGTHRGHSLYGDPTGKDMHFVGVTQWEIRDGVIQNEWTLFNELGLIMQMVA